MVTDEEFTQNMANLSRIHNHIFKHKKQQHEKRNHWSDQMGPNTRNKFI